MHLELILNQQIGEAQT